MNHSDGSDSWRKLYSANVVDHQHVLDGLRNHANVLSLHASRCVYHHARSAAIRARSIFDADDLDDATRLAIAREMNLSETAFVVRSDVADFGARYFTPAEEIPLAGHPTIATVFALIDSGRLKLTGDLTTISLELRVGPIRVDIEAQHGVVKNIVMSQKKPQFLRTYAPEEVMPVFGLTADGCAARRAAANGQHRHAAVDDPRARSGRAAPIEPQHGAVRVAARSRRFLQHRICSACKASPSRATLLRGTSSRRPICWKTRSPDRPPAAWARICGITA